MTAQAFLTPKDLADAIGASESSVRRWLDVGAVKLTRTTGGHRRIALPEAMRFIRESGATVVRPEILGLSGLRRRHAVPRRDQGAEELFEALRGGKVDVAQGLLCGWFLQGRPVDDIFDGPVRLAMHRIGELWKHEPSGILLEHWASLACADAILRLRELLTTPPAEAPSAIGGAPEDDFYLLPSLLAGTVLLESGYRDRNFGANTPLRLLAGAARETAASIVWVAISARSRRPLKRQLAHLAGELAHFNCTLVVGGRLAAPHAPAGPNVRLMSSMGELAAFARAQRR